MKDVIQHMLKVEEEGKALVSEAEQRAAEILEKRRRQATARVEEIRQAAHEEASRRVDEARGRMDAERARRLEEVDAENRRYADGIRTRIDAAADLVVKRVVGES